MTIALADIGKRFNREWIFRKINLTIAKGAICAVTGPNGSGKSTLLKLISQAELPSEGNIQLMDANGKNVHADKAYKYLSYAAPYVDLPEQLTFKEFFDFNQKFSPIKNKMLFEDFAKVVFLETARSKQICNFSSGMKQRLKLGMSILSQSDILILDEPTSNLDDKGVELYNSLLASNTNDRITLIGSNEAERELSLANQLIDMSDYK